MIALVEPDQGGEALLQRLMQSSHKDRIAAARLSGFKDVSELHIHEPERFDGILSAAVEGAEPLAQVQAAQAARPRRRRAAADEDDKQPTQADRLMGFAESEATTSYTAGVEPKQGHSCCRFVCPVACPDRPLAQPGENSTRAQLNP